MEKALTIYNRRYLGSKQKLLEFIKETVEKECGHINSFFDIFAGTGVVSTLFNSNNTQIVLNDSLKSSTIPNSIWFGENDINIEKVEKLVDELNESEPLGSNYFYDNFKNTYFSANDSLKIGYIREEIENLFLNNKINLFEKNYLITALIYSADKIANTVGHYDAYRKINEIEDKFVLYKLELNDIDKNKGNIILNMDANKAIEKAEVDLLYIDPPYNSRQYCDAYHLLENLVEWKKPEVFGVAKKMDRSNKKSIYSMSKAKQAFEDLIKKAKAKYIIVSYNNMGEKGNIRSQAKISDVDIIKILSEKGMVKIYESDFGYFNTGKSNISGHKERLFVCHVGKFDNTKINFDFDNEAFIKSPLNYTGGKFKLLDQIIPLFPKKINNFFDLFCGGANVGLNVNAEKIYCYDNQPQLINLLNYLKKINSKDLIDKLENLINDYDLSYSYKNGYDYYGSDSQSGLGKYNKDIFLKIRDEYNHNENINKDVYLLLLIFYAFNNQIRFNGSGKYNLPVGKRDLNKSLRTKLIQFVDKLKQRDIEFIEKDFRDFNIDKLNKDDFVYMDPPYLLGTASYNENNNWNINSELNLFDLMKNLNKNGIKFALSNVIEHKGKTHELLLNFVKENYLNIKYIKSDYKNSNYQLKSKNTTTIEVLITNY